MFRTSTSYCKGHSRVHLGYYLSASTTQSDKKSEQSVPAKQALHSQMGFPLTTKPSKKALPWPEHEIDATVSASVAAIFVQLCSHLIRKNTLAEKRFRIMEEIKISAYMKL